MDYDVIVLGGGPGGYLAAQRLAQSKKKVLCIEEHHLGGTCLNEGCIPTKTLLHSAKLYSIAKHSQAYGVTSQDVTFDHNLVINRKEEVIRTLVGGVRSSLKSCGVDIVEARGMITHQKDGFISVTAQNHVYTAKKLIIATGSSCSVPPIPGLKEGLDSGFVLTNQEMLSHRQLPKKIVVLGGGVIGLEMATYYAMAGVDTTVVEMLDHIGGANDEDMLKILQKNCESAGMHFLLGARVTQITSDCVVYQQDHQTFQMATDNVLLAIGRHPNISNIGLENMGVYTKNGAIVTDTHMQTNVHGVYAVGDVNGKIMLAHTAYREAEVAVHHMLGQQDCMRYHAIPSVLYTVPELSSVGETEASAKAKGYDVKVVKLPMSYSGRYVAEHQDGDGICKLIFDKQHHTLIGAHALSQYSSEFIIAASICMELELTARDMKELVFPHPTVSEILREAICKY